MSRIIQGLNLARMSYAQAYKIQKSILRSKIADTSKVDTILFVEHDPVYTVGLRRAEYSDDFAKYLKSLNASFEYTDRGGLVTFHGPGQLVAYPIFYLKNHTIGLKDYVKRLESVIIDLCLKEYNLKANRLCTIGYTGVWVNDAKIAALGIGSKRHVTYHGLALNCNVNLEWFSKIVPCGISDKSVTSLSQQLKKDVTVPEVLPKLVKSFENQFKLQIEMKTSDETQEIVNKILSEP